MPVHDWTRVSAGTFHDFHGAWIVELRNVLNNGLLPDGYYAMAEQTAGEVSPDLITLRTANGGKPIAGPPTSGTSTVTQTPPKVTITAETELDEYISLSKTLVIRHTSGDPIVALIEILSRGNKSSQKAMRSLLDKFVSALWNGIHLLIVDLYPPGNHDRQGIHGAVWGEIQEQPYHAPTDRPLTLASYAVGRQVRAYVEPLAVGMNLLDMPLFVDSENYISVPLENTYQPAYRGLAQKWRRVLESTEE